MYCLLLLSLVLANFGISQMGEKACFNLSKYGSSLLDRRNPDWLNEECALEFDLPSLENRKTDVIGTVEERNKMKFPSPYRSSVVKTMAALHHFCRVGVRIRTRSPDQRKGRLRLSPYRSRVLRPLALWRSYSPKL